MEKFKKVFAHVLKILKWVFLVLVGSFIILVIIRIPHAVNQQKTDAQIIKIHNTKLTLPDVMGEHLPPDPGIEADNTVQGIDANNNGIRDDVELAIFKEYPNSAKTRAVLLQYALTLQMMANQSFINTNVATAIFEKDSADYDCIGKIVPIGDGDLEKIDSYRMFVKNIQINTKERITLQSNFEKNIRSYELQSGCDIDLSTLPN